MKNIIEYFKNNVDCASDSIFCVDPDTSYTYKEAYRIVSNIAYTLNKNGISKSPILLRANRDNKTLLTILGIIMSNNYYVPINPEFSVEKTNSVIETSKITYEISFNEPTTGLKTFYFDEMINNVAPEKFYETISSDYSENDNIYTIYTSGSTGVPKGVLKTQKNVIAFVNNFISTFDFPNGLHIANQSPLFFDASMKDVYLCLATCSTLYFPDKTLFAMPIKLIEYLNDNKIDYLCWVPSALSIIVRLKTFNYLKPLYLKWVMFVGEVFASKYLNMWIDALPDITYVNLYGSTELAGICLYKVIKERLDEEKPIPLGRALNNNVVYLENDEIMIESDQIATCYVNDEEKNKTVFLTRDGKRVLRSGDYGYKNDDGDFVFSSRKDFQIKHMGYRIELQEIEIYLNALKYINNCAVLYDSDKDKLISFVSMNEDTSQKMIIDDLKAKLPGYMIPNRIVVLEELPLNANGKINRTKLKDMMEG